jgi:hypothetical protein
MIVRNPIFSLYRGRSMWPMFQEGDLLETEPVAAATLRVGDCVLFSDNSGRQVVHRVTALRGGVRTRGDALPWHDLETVQARQILGRVVRRHRLGRVTTVAGGWRGRWAGLFYRYAGRIDPERNACGGRLARGLRTLCAPLSRPLFRWGRSVTIAGDGQPELIVWQLGAAVLAVRQAADGGWRVPWPWRLVLAGPPPEATATFDRSRSDRCF